MDLSFLSNVELLSADEAKTKKASSIGARKERNPLTADLRLFKDGSVYPSLALVSEFNLEYSDKGAEVVGNGFDVFSSNNFKQLGAMARPVVFIATVGKASPKVDLFGRCTWAEDGKPNSLVGDQGSPTFGKNNLLPMLEEVYGFTFNNNPELSFIDLNIVRDYRLKTPSGVALIPKLISKGETAGQMTTERRENQEYMPLIIATEFSIEVIASPVADAADEDMPPVGPENEIQTETVETTGDVQGTELAHDAIETQEVGTLADLDEDTVGGGSDEEDPFGL